MYKMSCKRDEKYSMLFYPHKLVDDKIDKPDRDSIFVPVKMCEFGYPVEVADYYAISPSGRLWYIERNKRSMKLQYWMGEVGNYHKSKLYPSQEEAKEVLHNYMCCLYS